MKLFEPSLVPTCVGFLFKILLAILVTASCGHVLQDGDASSLILLLQLFVVFFFCFIYLSPLQMLCYIKMCRQISSHNRISCGVM